MVIYDQFKMDRMQKILYNHDVEIDYIFR